jgi:cytosine/adenosine deaminase-related metal-dependent hydrolase
LSHVIYPTHSEKKALYKRKPVITVSPTANMRLAANLAPISEYFNNGLFITVGLDGFAVTKSKTYIEELYALSHFIDVPQHIIVPKVLLSSSIVAMKLFGGGQLTTGAYADILVFDVFTENPWEYLSQKLNERDIYSLILNGEVVYGEPTL